MKKPPHSEPSPGPSGEPSKTRKNPDPSANQEEVSAPVAPPGITRRSLRIASLLVAAAAAVIPAGLKYFAEGRASEIPVPGYEVDPVHSVKFHESGIIRGKPLRAERNGFTRSFLNGKTLFPAEKVERSYSVYDPVEERFLGTLTVPDASCTDPIHIELDQASAFWKPAVKAAQKSP